MTLHTPFLITVLIGSGACLSELTLPASGDDNSVSMPDAMSPVAMPDAMSPPIDPGTPQPPEAALDYLEGLPKGATQRTALCARPNVDRFRNFYCATPAPTITSLQDLLVGLQMDADLNFAVVAHSSALLTRHTSVLNPQVIHFVDGPDYAALAYQRGDGFVEIIAFDTVRQDLNFYVVNYAKPGCTSVECPNSEKFLPSNESGWTSIDVYGDPDLHNTVLDCLQCHQPGGAGTKRILRMQEQRNPWTHWFLRRTNSSSLTDTFRQFHTEASYGGVPIAEMRQSAPDDLEDFIEDKGFRNDQVNEFRGDDINDDDPNVTTPNATWLALYQNAVDGEAISPPYFAISPFDDAKVNSAGAAYQAALGGAGLDTLPDLSEVFLDTPEAKAYLGFTAAVGLDATGLVMHRCAHCHDGRFPGISRDNFRVQDFPNNLTPAMKELTKARLRLPATSRFLMPPKIHSDLTPAQIALIEAALQ